MSEKTVLLICPNCTNKCQQAIEGLAHETWQRSSDENDVDHLSYTLCQCTTCGKVSLWSEYEGDGRALWPSNGELHHPVPYRVRELYAEAFSVKQRSSSLFAVSIRRCMEAICADKGVNGRTLQEMMNALLSSLGAPDVISSVARVARLLGNRGAHDSDDVTQAEADTLDEFFLAIIEYVYIGPEKVTRYEEALKKLDPSASP